MKRLRRFNESENDYIDYDYVYQCFAELLDDERAEIKLIESDSDQTEPYITITLKTDNLSIYSGRDHRISSKVNPIGDQNSPIYNHIKSHNTNNELLQEVKVSLNRLSDKYPDYKLQFSEYNDYIFIEIFKNKKERRRAF